MTAAIVPLSNLRDSKANRSLVAQCHRAFGSRFQELTQHRSPGGGWLYSVRLKRAVMLTCANTSMRAARSTMMEALRAIRPAGKTPARSANDNAYALSP